MLHVEQLCVELGDFSLKNVSFKVGKDDYFVLLGPSGTGKTVILEMISGLTPPDKGTIYLNDRDITSWPIQKRGIGLVYQDRALFPHLSVRDNVAYPLKGKGLSKGQLEAQVVSFAKTVEAEHLLDRFPETLSLGEAQRVALARTLASRPRLLLLDEPLASLDVSSRRRMRSLLRRVHRSGLPVIHVTHEFEEAIALATRVAVIHNGEIVQNATPDQVFHNPTSAFVANFVGIKNFFLGNLQHLTESAGDQERLFQTKAHDFCVSVDCEGERGFIVLRSEDIVLSLEKSSSSARNCFSGVIEDLEPVHNGINVSVDTGEEFHALITHASMTNMKLKPGIQVWVSFKSTACRFIELDR